MMINHLLDKITMHRRLREKAAHMFVAGICATVIVGAGVGAVLLFTTNSGKQIRRKMKYKAIEDAENLREIVAENSGRVKLFVDNTINDVAKTIADSYSKTENVKNDIRGGGRKIMDDIHETAENVKKDLDEE